MIKPHLQLITDRSLSKRPFLEMIEESLQGGVTLVQLREKNLATNDFLKLGEEVHHLTKKYQVPLIINDRLDIALAISAEGVHLGQSDKPYAEARKMLGASKIIGLTVENEHQVLIANQFSDIDYLGVSSIFATGTKNDIQHIFGLEGLQKVRSLTPHFLVGIGGINLDNCKDVIKSGADGIAVVSVICSNPHPQQIVNKLLEVIK